MMYQGQFHQRRKPSIIGTITTWAVMFVLMLALAMIFTEGLERTEFIAQARRAAWLDTMLYPDPPPTVSGRNLDRFQGGK